MNWMVWESRNDSIGLIMKSRTIGLLEDGKYKKVIEFLSKDDSNASFEIKNLLITYRKIHNH